MTRSRHARPFHRSMIVAVATMSCALVGAAPAAAGVAPVGSPQAGLRIGRRLATGPRTRSLALGTAKEASRAQRRARAGAGEASVPSRVGWTGQRAWSAK